MIVNVSIAVTLAISEYFFPKLVQWHYHEANDKIFDFIFTYLIMAISTFFVIKTLIENYRKEKQTINAANDELGRVNQQLNLLISEKDRIDQTKNKLFSVISHDLRSLAGPISGLSGVLLNNEGDNLNKNTQKIITSINESSKNLNILLENLLAWARIQMHSDKVNPENFSLNNLVHELTDLFQLNAKMKQQELVCKETKDQVVYADVEMTKSIVRNLLSNAIKFSKKGGTVEVCFSENTVLGTVELCVNDNGIGMTRSELKQLQQKDVFFTKNGTNLENGSGLGFIICQEFAEKNHGSIKVKSKAGEGSTFTLSLPKGSE